MDKERIIGNLKQSAEGPWVTFREARKQIRAYAKAKNLKLGSFRPRAINKSQLEVALADGTGHVVADRKPNAPVHVVLLSDYIVTDADKIARIQAELGTTILTKRWI